MGQRNPLHQPANAKGGVVVGPYVYDAPLLPYEKQLIATIGCSEQEYRWFVTEAIKRGNTRPAGYENIPDIRNEASLAIGIVSLVVGLASTAVSYLLTPKPRAPRAVENQRTQQQLDSIRGGNRFVPSSGFDTTAQLADYNSVIPIIFGLYNETENAGGILVSPRLVWSRMFSYGRQQSAKLMFVVGEQGKADAIGPDGLTEPDISGIFIGNNALDSVYSQSFAFYWKRNTTASGFSRIRQINLKAGTSGTLESADPNNGLSAALDDVFLCPTRVGELQPGFCHAYTPTNSANFGVYAPIPNGSVYRVNWRNVSIPNEEDPERRLKFEREKISGNTRMEGVGRNYSRRMGIVAYHGSGARVFDNNFRQEYEVTVGDEIDFLISNTKIPSDFYENKATVEDINSEIESQQIAVDDEMQIGELYSIGATVWQVIGREIDLFIPADGRSQRIRLKCTSTEDALFKRIGIVKENTVVNPPNGYVNDDLAGVGAGFYALTKISRATIRNNRRCDVTEIGIASTVYQQLNGLCNFQSLLSPDELEDADDNLVSVTSGTISSYVARSSYFAVYVRRAGLDSNGAEFNFAPLGLLFAVTGNRPVTQYNFIRFYHPNAPAEFEYRIVPRTAAELRNMSGEQRVIQLDAGSKNTYSISVSVGSYGTFRVLAQGRERLKDELTRNKEFYQNVDERRTTRTALYPTAVGVKTLLPDNQPDSSTFVTSVENLGFVSDPTNSTIGRMGAFTFAAFGNPDSSGVGENGRQSFVRKEILSNDRFVRLRYNCVKLRLPDDHYARSTGQQYLWSVDTIDVESSSPGFNSFETFIIKRGAGSTGEGTSTSNYPSTNPWAVNRSEPGNLLYSGFLLRVNGVQSSVDVRGRSQGYRFAVFGNPEKRNDNDRQVVDRVLFSPSGKQIKIEMEAYIYRDYSHWSGLTKFWSTPEIRVKESGTDVGWSAGETFDDEVSVTLDNYVAYGYSRVGARYQVLSMGESIIFTEFEAYGRRFEEQTQYAELTHYTGQVAKSCESDPEHRIVYVNEFVENEQPIDYQRLTTAGLVLRASREFSRLDQVRVWLPRGVQVRRLHPDTSTYQDVSASETPTEGPSNLFTDLVYFLLTNFTAGAGTVLNMNANNPNLIDVESFQHASRFLRSNKLFCNGAITEKVNLRDFISSNAPNFLCNFVIKNGKFGLVPAVPTNFEGEISTSPVQIKQIFTSGNILEDTFELEYLEAEDLRSFVASVRYRLERRNKLPEEKTVQLCLAESNVETLAIESFDLTQFCTTEHHAVMVARYFIAVRNLISHSIKFSTAASGLNLAPGDYIKVITEASPYSAAKNGTVNSTGAITSVTSIPDGTYNVIYYKTGSDDVQSGQMQVSNEAVSDSTFFNSVFTIQESTNAQNIYLVEQLTLNEDMTVSITASEYPCDSGQRSEIAKLITNDAAFKEVLPL
jgi:hypothetical protein